MPVPMRPTLPVLPARDCLTPPDSVIFGDVGEKRIADMDRQGISMQILSVASQSALLPKEEAGPVVRETNDRMAQAISRHPDRFAGFTALPWSDPEGAAQELERAVTKLGFKGAILSGRASAGKNFLDAPQFTPVLEAAEALDVPIYITHSAGTGGLLCGAGRSAQHNDHRGHGKRPDFR